MEKRGLNSFTLKIIALIFMTAGALLLLLDSEILAYERIFFRLAAVLFAFVLTEGFFYTANRQKYLGRLVVAGILMYVGNHLVARFTENNMPLEYGMFLTLAVGFGAMWVFQWVRTEADSFEGKMIGITVAAIISILAMMFAESGFYVIPVVLIGYFFHGKKLWISLLILAVSAILAINSISYTPSGALDWYAFFTENCDWVIVGVIPFVLLYSGRSGPSRGFSKWMFYVYYPLLVWTCSIVSA